MMPNRYAAEAISLLKTLISTPSFSREEEHTAQHIANFLQDKGVKIERMLNNIWAYNKHYDANKPTILLNSHHDTVKPNKGYTRDPFAPDVVGDKLYGLGSNDAGGCLVSLIMAFCHYYEKEDMAYNFCLATTSEEEISGKNGLELLYPHLRPIDFAIVGEPTLMDIAVAEKGLMVVDCLAQGIAGHAAREEGVNALYIALDDINWVRSYKFPKVSAHLGDMKMTATIIEAGSQHNVVPKECKFTVDVRITDEYTNEEVLEIMQKHMKSEVSARSVRLRPSFIDIEHPFVKACLNNGAKPYGSPTTSDQALIPVPSCKMGPGDSARSHSADEFIYVNEIEEGITKYIARLDQVL